MTDIARIVSELTASQKQKLIELSSGQPREYSLGRPGFALINRNLAFVNELGARHLTDLGHEVLKKLSEHSHDG